MSDAKIETGQIPPGPPARTLLRNPRAMQRDALGFLLKLTQQYGDVVRFPFLGHAVYFINHPDGVKRVLQENQRNYSKDTGDYRLLKLALGEGLLTSEGSFWRRQRRLIQPAFHRQRLAAFGERITAAAAELRAGWDVLPDRVVDIAEAMQALTLRIAGEVLFDLDLSGSESIIGPAVTTVNRFLSDYSYLPFPPYAWPTPRHRRVSAALAALDAAVYRIIAAHRHRGDTGDLLSLLLTAREADTGEGMSDRQVRDEVLTLLVAGHETTAVALAWTWYLLAQHPAVAERLHVELDAMLGGRLPTVADLPHLPYTQQVLDEVMRLYPPAWALGRKAVGADTIGGYAIPAGAAILLTPYTTHRHPAFWPQPERFDPGRFRPEQVAARPAFAYYPFGGGPRLCIGRPLALLEAPLILATLAQRYRPALVPGAPVVPEALITLRPRAGLLMRLERRET